MLNSHFRTTVRITDGGRIAIPSEVRRRLGIKVGSELILTIEGDHAILGSALALRRRARQMVRRYASPGVDLCGELISERRAETHDQ